MIALMDKHYICPLHGRIKGDRCILCDTLSDIINRKKTLLSIPLHKILPEGKGRKKGDPSPLQIAYRARKERMKKENRRAESFTKGWRRFWSKKQRIVRRYPDNTFGKS